MDCFSNSNLARVAMKYVMLPPPCRRFSDEMSKRISFRFRVNYGRRRCGHVAALPWGGYYYVTAPVQSEKWSCVTHKLAVDLKVAKCGCCDSPFIALCALAGVPTGLRAALHGAFTCARRRQRLFMGARGRYRGDFSMPVWCETPDKRPVKAACRHCSCRCL